MHYRADSFLCSMKFAERALIIMCLIGYYLAVWRRPQDVSVLFVGAAALSVLYVLSMPLLLANITIRELGNKEMRNSIRWSHWLAGSLFGALSAYCAFSIIYHSLGQMDSLAMIENCGLGLLLFTALATWQRKKQEPFYGNMLVRIAFLVVLIMLSLLVHRSV